MCKYFCGCLPRLLQVNILRGGMSGSHDIYTSNFYSKIYVPTNNFKEVSLTSSLGFVGSDFLMITIVIRLRQNLSII